jgi:hypothetical protein
MELTWPMKLRIAAAIACGFVLVGVVAWPSDSPLDPFGSAILTKSISNSDIVTLLIMSFIAGLIAYFCCWPYGRQIAALAVPFGLTIWAVRTGSMAGLMQTCQTLGQRQQLLTTLRWEPFFWLAVIAVGFIGIIVGQKIFPDKKPLNPQQEHKKQYGKYLNLIVTLPVSVLIVLVCIKIFAQDVTLSDNRLGSVIAQPAIGQIIFAVLASSGIAAFVVRTFFSAGYIWSIIACSIVTTFFINSYIKSDTLSYLVDQWPATFFPNVIVSILPVQMVAFGTIGAIAGYWTAVHYNFQWKHKSK